MMFNQNVCIKVLEVLASNGVFPKLYGFWQAWQEPMQICHSNCQVFENWEFAKNYTVLDLNKLPQKEWFGDRYIFQP